MQKYGPDSFGSRKIFFMTGSKEFVLIFIIIIKNYTINLSFYKVIVFIPFKIVLEPC